MDLRLKEVTWLRLLSLLMWTILVMIRHGVSQLIDAIEGRVFEKSERPLSGELRSERVGSITLLPPLSDDLVITRIWPLLHKRVNVSLIWRLRRVNHAWKRSVSLTLEWAALEMVRIDSPGYLRFLRDRGERRPSLQDRVEDEKRSLSVLLSEQLADFSLQSEGNRSKVADYEFGDESKSSSASLVKTDCVCRFPEFTCITRDYAPDRSKWQQSNREEFWETDTSSSGSSMRTYFPRHQF